MPQHKQAIKRVRQNKKNRAYNRAQRSKITTLIKNVKAQTEKESAEEHLKKAVSFLDKMTAKGIIHRNNAARKKAQLTKFVNNL